MVLVKKGSWWYCRHVEKSFIIRRDKNWNCMDCLVLTIYTGCPSLEYVPILYVLNNVLKFCWVLNMFTFSLNTCLKVLNEIVQNFCTGGMRWTARVMRSRSLSNDWVHGINCPWLNLTKKNHRESGPGILGAKQCAHHSWSICWETSN